MEDGSFRSRVDRAFSLLLPPEQQQQQHSMACADGYWTVSEQQQSDKNKWNGKNKKREEDDAPPFCHEDDGSLLKLCGGSDEGIMHRQLSDSLERLERDVWAPKSGDDGFEDDEIDEQEGILQNQGGKIGDEDDEDDEDEELKQLRMGIGVDETVDLEEEEDEYDRAAVGQEEDDDRVFMKFISSYDQHKDKLSSLHASVRSRVLQRDFHADHAAAAARLAEDDVEARASNMIDLFQSVMEVQPSKNGSGRSALNCSEQPVDMDTEATQLTSHPDLSRHPNAMKIYLQKDSLAVSQCVEITEHCFREKDTGSGHIMSTNSGRSDEPDMECQDTDCSSGFSTLKEISGIQTSNPSDTDVPDHVKHPWKYKYYTLDGPDYADKQCNIEAFPEHEMLKGTDPTPELIRFIPRSKDLLDAGKSENNDGSTDVKMHQVSLQFVSGIARSMQSQNHSGLSESLSDTEESTKSELSTIQRRYRRREIESDISG